MKGLLYRHDQNFETLGTECREKIAPNRVELQHF